MDYARVELATSSLWERYSNHHELIVQKDKEYLRKKYFYNVNKWIHYEVSFLSLYLNADRLGFEPRPYKLTVYCTTIMLSVQ